MDSDFSSKLMKDINKEMGEEVAFLLEDGSPSDVETFIPTGSTLLDYIISNQKKGGIPVGKVTEISGLEGTGKTLLAMQICANTQKLGGLPIYFDTEHALNTDFAERVGLNTKENFIYLTPGSVEDVFKSIFTIIHKLDKQEKEKKEAIPFITIVWDSVAATPTRADLADENPDPASTVGLKPRILSKNIYTLLKMTGRRRLALIFLNQLRMNIRAQAFQDPYVTPGGKAIPFAASARVRITNTGKVKVGEDIVGIQCKVKCVKTRFGPPYRDCDFPLYFTHGIDDWESIVDLLIENKLILSKRGGPLGNLFYLKGDSESNALSKVDFKKKIKADPALLGKIQGMLESIMIRPMINPEDAVIEVIASTGDES